MCASSCSVYVTSSRSLLRPWEYRQYMRLKCPFTRQHGVITGTPPAEVLPNGQLFKWDFLFTVQPKCLCNATPCCWCSSSIRDTRWECRNVGHHSPHSVLFVTSHSVYSSSSPSLPLSSQVLPVAFSHVRWNTRINRVKCWLSRRLSYDSSVGIATRYRLDGAGIESRTDRPWGPLSLLYSEYRLIPGGKSDRAWRLPPTPSSTEVKKRLDVYLYSRFLPSWQVIGRSFPLYLPCVSRVVKWKPHIYHVIQCR
jgi:hypothetical protein